MTQSPQIYRREARIPPAPASAASLLEAALSDAAGVDAAPVSMTLDYAAQVPEGASVVVEAWVERATRTLMFIHGRLSAADGGELLASASTVFRRLEAGASRP